MLTMVPHMEWWNGCVDYVKENCPDMECIVDEPYEDKNDNQVAYDKGIEVLKANPDVCLLYTSVRRRWKREGGDEER